MPGRTKCVIGDNKKKVRELKTKSDRMRELTQQMKDFIGYLLASPTWDITWAAKKAGYKPYYAQSLFKDARIQLAIAEAIQQRNKRLEIRQDDLVEYLRQVLYFNPLKYFMASKDGKWVITDPTNIPDEIGMLIEEVKIKSTTNSDGDVTDTFEVRLVSKTVALGLALKHVGADPNKIRDEIDRQSRVRIDWDDLCNQVSRSSDALERKILDVKALDPETE